MMNVDKLFHLLMGCHTGGLSNLLNEYPKGCSTDFEGDVKRLFDSYSELASSGYLEVGKDILASGITVEVGDRIESSYGRMIAQISYEVLDAIFQEAAKRPIGICQFEPYLDLQDWKGLSKLSQAEIQAIAKRQALIDSTKLEGLMRRMLVEFENVVRKHKTPAVMPEKRKRYSTNNTPTKPKIVLEKRDCLRCGKQFDSTGKGNRICVTCNNRNHEASGMREFTVTIGRGMGGGNY